MNRYTMRHIQKKIDLAVDQMPNDKSNKSFNLYVNFLKNKKNKSLDYLMLSSLCRQHMISDDIKIAANRLIYIKFLKIFNYSEKSRQLLKENKRYKRCVQDLFTYKLLDIIINLCLFFRKIR